MHRISTYAEYVYWPWFATTILNPLTRDGAFHWAIAILQGVDSTQEGKWTSQYQCQGHWRFFLLDLSSMPPERSPLEDGDFMNSPAFLFFFFPFFSFPLSYYCYCYSTFWCFVLLFYHFYTPGIFTLFFKTCLAASTVGNRELLIDPPQSVERIKKKKNRSSERKTHQPTN